MMNEKYTGFSNCKYIAEFEKALRLKKIQRKNEIKLSTEAILDPSKFLEHIEEIKSKLNFQRTNSIE